MKKLTPWILGACLAATAAWAPAAIAAQPATPPAAHAHDEALSGKLALDKGRKWATDAPLRTGMSRIRTLTAGALDDAHAGKFDAKASASVAAQVEQQVAGIVANCKLEPQADAMLHLVIADIGAGTGAMAGKVPGRKSEDGLLQLAQAVNAYGRHFQHPGFKPVETGH
ncbi:MAG: hypothetical protein EOO30_15715 [Comamonadaceae bacterium]|nr:MAG: hypothetical protein EOO30_15715 [Comamonadaceae bacterium]